MEEENTVQKVMGIMKLIESMQNGITQEKPEEITQEKQEENIQPEGTRQEASTAFRTIKAAIPYLDPRYQRNLGLMIKLMEIDSLIHRYSVMTLGGQRVSPQNKRKMLDAVRNELEPRQKHILDIFVRIVEIKELMEVYQNE